jgi:hypothetical protein
MRFVLARRACGLRHFDSHFTYSSNRRDWRRRRFTIVISRRFGFAKKRATGAPNVENGVFRHFALSALDLA